MPVVDLEAFRSADLVTDPFEHVIVSGFLAAERLSAIQADSPHVERHGNYPTSELKYGSAFAALLKDLQSPEVTMAVGEKFALDLSNRPTIITMRGRTSAKDGRIHTDSLDKLITVLIYLNSPWDAEGGRLRLLRSPDDLDDFAVEVAPDSGTMLAFRRSEKSYHGHAPFVGERRVLQLNWVTDDGVVSREYLRHRRSARIKRWLPFA